jgi:hypothetical protein
MTLPAINTVMRRAIVRDAELALSSLVTFKEAATVAFAGEDGAKGFRDYAKELEGIVNRGGRPKPEPKPSKSSENAFQAAAAMAAQMGAKIIGT